MSTDTDRAIVDRVKARRGGQLIALDRTLLHSPPVADGWNSFLGAIRTQTSLETSIRELAICRVAMLNKAWYEWHAHAPILEASGGLSAEGIEFVKTAGVEEGSLEGFGERGRELLGERHWAVLRYTDAMTRGCVVPQPVFEGLKAVFSEREVVEVTSTVAAYNCVSRFLVALDVGEMAEKYGIDMS